MLVAGIVDILNKFTTVRIPRDSMDLFPYNPVLCCTVGLTVHEHIFPQDFLKSSVYYHGAHTSRFDGSFSILSRSMLHCWSLKSQNYFENGPIKFYSLLQISYFSFF
jgi:hypothetical protein